MQVKNNELVKIIKDAALAYKNSSSILGLEKDSFEIEVSFSITKTTGGGVEFEVYGVGFEGDAEWERKVGHTVVLEFK